MIIHRHSVLCTQSVQNILDYISISQLYTWPGLHVVSNDLSPNNLALMGLQSHCTNKRDKLRLETKNRLPHKPNFRNLILSVTSLEDPQLVAP